MIYEKIWCEPLQTDLDFSCIASLEALVVLLENNDCLLESITTNQCYEVHIFSELNNTTYIYKSNIGLEEIFKTVYLLHCNGK